MPLHWLNHPIHCSVTANATLSSAGAFPPQTTTATKIPSTAHLGLTALLTIAAAVLPVASRKRGIFPSLRPNALISVSSTLLLALLSIPQPHDSCTVFGLPPRVLIAAALSAQAFLCAAAIDQRTRAAVALLVPGLAWATSKPAPALVPLLQALYATAWRLRDVGVGWERLAEEVQMVVAPGLMAWWKGGRAGLEASKEKVDEAVENRGPSDERDSREDSSTGESEALEEVEGGGSSRRKFDPTCMRTSQGKRMRLVDLDM